MKDVKNSYNIIRMTLCIKDTCKRCDMVFILKDYVKPIMQLLSNDLNDFYMGLLTTKCLNTAIMIMYFMVGKEGIKISKYCDTRATIKRHTNNIDNNNDIMIVLKKDILNPNIKNRYIYYILLTDAYFPRENEQTFFPGHVILIEKTPSNIVNEKPYYYMYQSYINKYDLAGHYSLKSKKSSKIDNNDSVKMTYDELSKFINKLGYIMNSSRWDDNCIKYWKDFTFIDTQNMRNSECKNKFYICYKRALVNTCIGNIKKYTQDKLKILKKVKNDNDIYGDTMKYKDTEIALTNGSMRYSLENLLYKLKTK